MKIIRLTLHSLLALSLLFILVRCGKDEVTPLTTLSGTVTYPGETGSSAASGAVVYLAKTLTGNYDYSTVADASGTYIFSNLEEGTYYLNAWYYTENNNSNTRLEGVTFTIGDNVEVTVGSTDVMQDLALISSGQSITTVTDLDFDLVNRAGTAGDPYDLGSWTMDTNHSLVEFAFDFDDGNAEFTGSFGRVTKINITFDPANLSSSSISAEIDLMSVNTRTRGGRDPLWDGDFSTLNETTVFEETNCIASTFGIFADGPLPSVVTDPQRYASFVSTSIEEYGDGYIANGNMIFSADMTESPANPYGIDNNPNTQVTKPVSIIFKYRPGWEDATRYYASFEGKMIFDAKGDFNIFSSHVLDELVKVYMNIEVRKNK